MVPRTVRCHIHPSVLNLTELTDRIKRVANKLHLQEVYVFGFFARGQNKDSSDVDLFVSGPDFLSYSAIWEVQDELEQVYFLLKTCRASQQKAKI